MKLEKDSDEMLPEYDFAGGVRGKYTAAYHAQDAVVIDAGLLEYFPNSESMNAALRRLLRKEPFAKAS
ncbi:MAG: hypothetical protein PW792_09175 [Acidobacteriaceae bacterium]|nr:hypothetical protein [Acidobacteriaceae bacterium]